jgi:hypothetical protein
MYFGSGVLSPFLGGVVTPTGLTHVFFTKAFFILLVIFFAVFGPLLFVVLVVFFASLSIVSPLLCQTFGCH